MPDSLDKSAEGSVFSVDTLIKYMGNDASGRATVAKIVGDAMQGAEQPMRAAATAVREGRYAEAARALHGLRGSIGTLGAQRFVRASMAVEVAIAEQRHDELPSLLAEAEKQFQLTLNMADAWLQAHIAA